MNRVITRLDKTIIDGRTIKLSQAKYPKPTSDKVGSVEMNRQKNATKGPSRRSKEDVVISNPKILARDCRVVSEELFFKDTLLNNVNLGSGKVEAIDLPSVIIQEEDLGGLGADVTIPAADNGWMKSCLVGLIKNSFDEDLIQKAILQEGIEAKMSKREALSFWFDHIAPLLINGVPHYLCRVGTNDDGLRSGESHPAPIKGFFRSSIRRALRRQIRDSIDGDALHVDNLNPQSNNPSRFSNVEMKAGAVGEVSNLPGVSFKGGRDIVINRVLKIFHYKEENSRGAIAMTPNLYHNVVLLSESSGDWGHKPFRCFNYWFEGDGFEKTVIEALIISKRRNPQIRIGGLIKNSKLTFKNWAGKSIGDSSKIIADLEKELSAIEESLQHPNPDPKLLIVSSGYGRSIVEMNEVGCKNQGYSGSMKVLDIDLEFKQISEANASLLEKEFPVEEVWEVSSTSSSNRAPDFYLGREWELGINHSFITLIPKADHWRNLIPLLDCSLVANEAIDFVNKTGRSGIAFKIDLQRAYDAIDWDFLICVVKKCGFGNRWCYWILKCISSARISVLVNEAPIEAFSISRGLRQGVFELASGLKLNLKKSKMLGINVEELDLQRRANMVGCLVDKFPISYLGLPLGANQNTSNLWKPPSAGGKPVTGRSPYAGDYRSHWPPPAVAGFYKRYPNQSPNFSIPESKVVLVKNLTNRHRSRFGGGFYSHHSVLLGPYNRGSFGESPNYGGDSPLEQRRVWLRGASGVFWRGGVMAARRRQLLVGSPGIGASAVSDGYGFWKLEAAVAGM
ncbi:hypothetical protein F3Y22_tig00005936pilonHSYRG00057 [Hibiscus syriacus]|uniref:Uncharacterized protein n=1 Tax=Hibiscus syriacus TaxID=106335 RepID=A0A6A3CHK2_HIBSY|nr:hypothetical protein F3Y22_tig00005936pilonHSYRG00057 [Hibiscus syriacus]